MTKHTTWIYGLVILCVILLHGTGHRYGLPYVEHYDEGRIFYNAALQRGAAEGEVDLPAYPPALLWMHGIIQPITEQITGRPSELEMGATIGILRLLAVLSNALSAAVLVWCGRRVTGLWAVGLLAAAAWTTAPDTLYNTVIGLTEPYLILTSLLALAWALAALYEKSERAALLSVVAGLVGVMFKYSAFPSLGFGVSVALWLAWNDRRWLRPLALQAVLIIGTAVFLLTLGGGIGTLLGWSPESQAFTQGGLARILDLSWWQRIVEPALGQLRWSIPAFLALAFGGTVALIRLPDRNRRLIWVGLLFFIVCMLALTIAYLAYMEGVYRYVTPISPFISLLISLAIANILQALMQGQETSSKGMRNWPALVYLVIGVLWLAPVLPTTFSILQERTRPDTRAALADWSLPVLTEPYQIILQDSRDERTFVRDRAGYRGLWHWQRWEEPFQQSPEAWRAENVNWLMATEETYQRLTETDEGRAWADDILLLKSFPPAGETWRGPSLWFYRLTPPMTAADTLWNETVRLTGYDLERNDTAWSDETLEIQAGDTLSFTGYWQAAQTPSANLHVFLHIRPAEDLTQVVAQADGPPVAQRPTTTWTDPQETFIGTPYSITWPDVPKGDYVFIIGLYDLATGARWINADGSDGWTVLPIRAE